MSTVPGTTPYPWPYDGAFAPSRTAVLVLTTDGVVLTPSVAATASAVRAAGGAVLEVGTVPPVRSRPVGRRDSGPPVVDADVVLASRGVDGFYGSALDAWLREAGCDQLLLCGGWLETAVHSTMRSANDRGYECLLVLDACTPYDAALLAAARSQVEMSGGIFGAVGGHRAVLAALQHISLERNAG